MKSILIALAILVGVAAIGAVAVPAIAYGCEADDQPTPVQGQDANQDLQKLQGVWRIVTVECKGKDLADWVKDVSPKFIFNKDGYVITAEANSESGKIKLACTRKLRTIDFQINDGNDHGKHQLGIYQLNGDDLKICVAVAGTPDRPTEFKTEAESPRHFNYLTLKRVRME